MTCCEHRAICHAYRPATRRNDGRCLSRGCGCVGGIALQIGGNDVFAWDNGSHNKAAPAVRQHRDSGASPTIKESTDG